MQTTNPFADKALPAGPRLESVGSPLNPYTAPAEVGDHHSAPDPGIGLWRHKDLVIIHHSLSFPERCIWTNQAVRHDYTLKHAPWFAQGQGPLKFRYSLSSSGRLTMLANQLWTGAVIAVGGVVFGLGLLTASLDGVLSGGALLFMGLVLFRLLTRPLKVVERDEHYVAIRGACEPFLNSLPRIPIGPAVKP